MAAETSWAEEYASTHAYHHVTPQKNITSILKEGLDPKYGGINGASDLHPSEEARRQFKNNSKGKVHLTAPDGDSSFYEDFLESQNVKPAHACVTVVGKSLEFDPDHDDGFRFRTKDRIGASNVYEGIRSSCSEGVKDDARDLDVLIRHYRATH